MKWRLAMVVAIGLLMAAAPREEESRTVAGLEGKYRCVVSERDGADDRFASVKELQIDIDQHRIYFCWKLWQGDDLHRSVPYWLEREQTPQAMRIGASPGIYEATDDYLTICFDPELKARPTLLSTQQGSGHVLWILERMKP